MTPLARPNNRKRDRSREFGTDRQIPFPSPKAVSKYNSSCPVPVFLIHPQSAGNHFRLLPGLPVAAIADELDSHTSTVSRSLMTGNVTLENAPRVISAIQSAAGVTLTPEEFAALVAWIKNHPISVYYRQTGRTSPVDETERAKLKRLSINPAWKNC